MALKATVSELSKLNLTMQTYLMEMSCGGKFCLQSQLKNHLLLPHAANTLFQSFAYLYD